ncbi:hypothetical protein [Mesomycoplasma lagogenitalium]|uniref:Lipoprotein n=1 Tax=Mesomycoplasma lagogenitalium TaxID=171286 RepID=A0ABY8LX50_9BACT|nr:hypothetical protein [Mesomycoplasma lagogenitalium]WGI36991.1 hypothetical protein QEG99_01755 [Mesomycoplasma lagogenitalium]
MKIKSKKIKKKIIFKTFAISASVAGVLTTISCNEDNDEKMLNKLIDEVEKAADDDKQKQPVKPYESSNVLVEDKSFSEMKSELISWINSQENKEWIPTEQQINEMNFSQLKNWNSKITLISFIEKQTYEFPNVKNILKMNRKEFEKTKKIVELLALISNNIDKTDFPTVAEVFQMNDERIDKWYNRLFLLKLVSKSEDKSNLPIREDILNFEINVSQEWIDRLKFKLFLASEDEIYLIHNLKLEYYYDEKDKIFDVLITLNGIKDLPTWEEINKMDSDQLNKFAKIFEIINWLTKQKWSHFLPTIEQILSLKSHQLEQWETKKIELLDIIVNKKMGSPKMPSWNDVMDLKITHYFSTQKAILRLISQGSAYESLAFNSLPTWEEVFNMKSEDYYRWSDYEKLINSLLDIDFVSDLPTWSKINKMNYQKVELWENKAKIIKWILDKTNQSKLPSFKEVINFDESEVQNWLDKIEILDWIYLQEEKKIYNINTERIYQIDKNETEITKVKIDFIRFINKQESNNKNDWPTAEEIFNFTYYQSENLKKKIELIKFVNSIKNTTTTVWEKIIDLDSESLKNMTKLLNFVFDNNSNNNYLPNLEQILNLNPYQLSRIEYKIKILDYIKDQSDKSKLPTWEQVMNFQFHQLIDPDIKIQFMKFVNSKSQITFVNWSKVFALDSNYLEDMETILEFVIDQKDKSSLPTIEQILNFDSSYLNNARLKTQVLNFIINQEDKVKLPTWSDIMDLNWVQLNNLDDKILFLKFLNRKEDQSQSITWKEVFNFDFSQLDNLETRKQLLNLILNQDNQNNLPNLEQILNLNSDKLLKIDYLLKFISRQNDKSNLPSLEQVFNLTSNQLENLNSKTTLLEFINKQNDKTKLPTWVNVMNLTSDQLNNLNNKIKFMQFINSKTEIISVEWNKIFNLDSNSLDNMKLLLEFIINQTDKSNLPTFEQVFSLTTEQLSEIQLKIRVLNFVITQEEKVNYQLDLK